MESGQTGMIGKIVQSHVEVEAKLELEYVTTQSRHSGERSAEKTTTHCHIRPECAMRMHAQVKNKLFFETLTKFEEKNIFLYNFLIASYFLTDSCKDKDSTDATGIDPGCKSDEAYCSQVLEDCKNTCACSMLCLTSTDSKIFNRF